MKISLLPAVVGLTVVTGAPAYAACLSDVTKFQDRMEAYWQSANYQASEPQEPEESGADQQRQEASDDNAADKSIAERTGATTEPRTTEDARKEEEEKQARADPNAAEKATETVTEEVVETGKTIKEDGGTTTYAAGGPAEPTENWFGKPPRQGEIVSKLDEAREYANAGDENACNEALGAAQKLADEDR